MDLRPQSQVLEVVADDCIVEAPEFDLKRGTEVLLATGTHTAMKMAQQNIRPHVVGKVLQADALRSAQSRIRRRLHAPVPEKTVFVEFCCSPTSKVGEIVVEAGSSIICVALPLWDAGNERDVDRRIQKCQRYMDKG